MNNKIARIMGEIGLFLFECDKGSQYKGKLYTELAEILFDKILCIAEEDERWDRQDYNDRMREYHREMNDEQDEDEDEGDEYEPLTSEMSAPPPDLKEKPTQKEKNDYEQMLLGGEK